MRFDDIVTGHLDWIARQAFALAKDRMEADDLAQDTLLKILRNKGSFDNARDFKPWALTIMLNTYKTQCARRSRVQMVDIGDSQHDAPSSNSADGIVRARDVLRAVRDASRVCVGVECVALYAKGYTYLEIADIKGINIGTVRSRIAAGRRIIRTLLGY